MKKLDEIIKKRCGKRKIGYKIYRYEMFGMLGKRTVMKVPNCVLTAIRAEFPVPECAYMGFEEKKLFVHTKISTDHLNMKNLLCIYRHDYAVAGWYHHKHFSNIGNNDDRSAVLIIVDEKR